MNIRKLLMSALLIIASLTARAQFLTRTNQTNLSAFTSINGQWVANSPTNNTLGATFYQGLNFGYDANNYISLVNGVGNNELYFGRWQYEWKGWNRIWHSGNLNTPNSNFQAKELTASKFNLSKPSSNSKIEALNIDVSSFGNQSNSQNSHFLRIRDIGANATQFIIKGDGTVGIGTTNTSFYKLSVNGSIRSKEVKVEADWADFVFMDDYELWTLEEVEKFIRENKHLPEIPSEKEVKENGINLGEMNSKLLQKIEELTLYMIDMNKRMSELEQRNTQLEKEISSLR